MNASGDLSGIWQLVVEKLREKYSSTFVGLWFEDCKILDLDENRVLLYIENDFKRGVVQGKYAEEIAETIEGLLGFRIKIEFTGDPTLTAQTVTRREEEENRREEKNSSLPGNIPGSKTAEFTFENFVQGSSNKLAYAACYAVASNAGDKDYDHIGDMYNPLFIYGPSGLGKTHLMYSIKNMVERCFPDVSLIYISGEDFTNQLIEAIQFKRTPEFREKFRRADILIIDDIQFIANKTSVQEEVFHTFNFLYEDNKQIIFTSDKPPKDINPLEERLRTRFEQSMIADIQPPDIELRMAIIKQKAKNLHIELSSEVVTYMADRLKSNIRQVEGAIKKIAALSFLAGTGIQLETALAAISDLLTESEPQNLVSDKIIEAVARKYSISAAELKGKSQAANTVNARNVAIYLLRSLTDLSMIAIGNMFGRSHATIHHSLAKIEEQIAGDPLFEDEIKELVSEIRG